MAGLLDHYRAMARYNRWMNGRIYSVAEQLQESERRNDMKAFFGSIQRTLNHILLGDRAWLGRFTGDRRLAQSLDRDGAVITPASFGEEVYSDIRDLRTQREQTDAAILEFVDSLSDDQINGSFRYKTSAGQPCEHPLWWALSHFFNHQTHHRGQLTTLFTQLGHDPGVTDLIALLRSEVPTS